MEAHTHNQTLDNNTLNNFDNRRIALEAFDNTKLGVKGLVDSNITHIPTIFHHPPETLFTHEPSQNHDLLQDHSIVPVVDLLGADHDGLVNQVQEAASKFGFLQVINHGVPINILNRSLDAIKAFHELHPKEKMRVYCRDIVTARSGVGFYSNYDLFQSRAASWMDTLAIRLAPTYVDPTDIPDICSKELLEFDNTKLGVKGLVDSGITHIPPIFHHPSETLLDHDPTSVYDQQDVPTIPVVNLLGANDELVNQLRDASAKFGFFQVINHGVSIARLESLIDAIKAFHELPSEEKISMYRRDTGITGRGVGFYSNYDLFHSKGASWRDSLSVRLAPYFLDPSDIPHVCRSEVLEWDKEVIQLGERLMGLLSQGLGLQPDKLTGKPYLGRRALVGNYYPYCPEPNKTIGIASHTDPGILTVLLQDQIGGLQVKHDGKWVDLKPAPGALVVNIGDLLQIISNDIFKSGEHRVQANPFHKPRVSIAVFFSPGEYEYMYGPLPELVSPEKPALYKQFKFSDLLKNFFSRELEGKSMTSYVRL